MDFVRDKVDPRRPAGTVLVQAVEAYDPKRDTWRKLPPLPFPIGMDGYDGCAEVIGDVLYVIGRMPPYTSGLTVVAFKKGRWSYSDGDGLSDAEEIRVYGTNPKKADTDNDGLSDGAEVRLGTNPIDADTDGDGAKDWDDPTPLVRGVPGSRIVTALRAQAASLADLPPSVFDRSDPVSAERLRKATRDEIDLAAGKLSNGDRDGAIRVLEALLGRINGGLPGGEWLVNGPEKATLTAEIRHFIDLIRIR
jgi:hypothetical protein